MTAAKLLEAIKPLPSPNRGGEFVCCSPPRTRGFLRREPSRTVVDRKPRLDYARSMYATIHGRGRMMIPAQARKKARIVTGDVVSVQPEGNGRIVLVKMKQPKSKPVRQKLFNIEPWDSEDLARALRNQQADRDYPIEAMIRAQAFPRD